MTDWLHRTPDDLTGAADAAVAFAATADTRILVDVSAPWPTSPVIAVNLETRYLDEVSAGHRAYEAGSEGPGGCRARVSSTKSTHCCGEIREPRSPVLCVRCANSTHRRLQLSLPHSRPSGVPRGTALFGSLTRTAARLSPPARVPTSPGCFASAVCNRPSSPTRVHEFRLPRRPAASRARERCGCGGRRRGNGCGPRSGRARHRRSAGTRHVGRFGRAESRLSARRIRRTGRAAGAPLGRVTTGGARPARTGFRSRADRRRKLLRRCPGSGRRPHRFRGNARAARPRCTRRFTHSADRGIRASDRSRRSDTRSRQGFAAEHAPSVARALGRSRPACWSALQC